MNPERLRSTRAEFAFAGSAISRMAYLLAARGAARRAAAGPWLRA